MHGVLARGDLQRIRFNDAGLVPVIAQDHDTGRVLMLAWANHQALADSLASGKMTYWSRSRNELWEKGASSGNTQRLIQLRLDCDGDAVLAIVEQAGPACHTGTPTCWNDVSVATIAGALDEMARQRLEAPAGRYTDSLLADVRLAAAKVVEEAGEVSAVLNGIDNEDTLEHEAADLLYHLVIALRAGGSSLDAVLRELARRQ
jgi:phosphoribosyl-ATP pyrophosphohydrolase/phosphoribosyl-AMP cyclohydrolase